MEDQKDLSGVKLVLVLFAVVITLAFISTLNPFPFGKEGDDASFATSKIQINSFLSACNYYYSLTGQHPRKLEDFIQKPNSIENWRPLLEEIPLDPWGNPYLFKNENNCITISSGGASSEPEDDITAKKTYEEIIQSSSTLKGNQ